MPAIKKPKKEKVIEPFFKEMVEVFFSFTREKFNESPTFSGSAPRDLKSIISTLRLRAEKSNIEWNLDTARQRFNHFLTYAWQQKWLREHWLLSNFSRQQDTIFYQIRADIQRHPADPFE